MEVPVLRATPEGPTVEVGGRSLYAPDTPRTSADRRALAADLPERCIVLVPSVGLGYGLRSLIDRCPPTSHILCIEVDQNLMKLAVETGGLPRHASLSIYRADDPYLVAELARRLGLERFRRCRLVNLCGGYQLARTLYDAMYRTLERLLAEYWQNRMTTIHLAALWTKNCLDNLPLLPDTVPMESLGGTGPIYVVGAGPTLNEAAEVLRHLPGEARILAVDTALPVLAGYGIRPDLIFVLEAQHANLYDFLPLPDPATPLVADLTAHPGCLRRFQGPRCMVLTAFRDLSLFRRMESRGLRPRAMRPLGSVGVAACAVALELTRQEVITVGLDFAYHGDRTHARGAPFHALALTRATRLEPALNFHYRAMHKRPLRAHGEWSSDAVLESYAVTLRELAASTGRLHKMNADGTLEPWAQSHTPLETPASPPAHGRPGPADVADQYAEELILIEKALRALEGPDPDPACLRAVDYAVAHFPESARLDDVPTPYPPGYAARVRQALVVYRGRIRRLAARL